MIELLLLTAGIACIIHGVRGLRRDVSRWAGRLLDEIAATDMREWYRR